MKQLVKVAALLVLCGVVALSVPAFADRNPQATKTTTASVAVTAASPAVSAEAAKTASARPTWRQGLCFWLRHFLGLPPIHVETKPPDSGQPLKSVGDAGSANNWTGKPIQTDVDRDNGGSYEEL